MPNNCQTPTWACPTCQSQNKQYISKTTITNCTNCRESVSWNGVNVVTYTEWLAR